MNRRRFLRDVAAGSTFSLLGGWATFARAMAAVARDPGAKFVMIRVHGAMDSTLGLHPHLVDLKGIDRRDLFVSDGFDPVRDVLRPEGVQFGLGTAAEPIAQFAKRMAIVRGIHVGPNDLGHPFAIQHMSAGRTQESAPGWTAYIGRLCATESTYVVTNSPLQRGQLPAFPILLTSSLRSQAVSLAGSGEDSSLSLYRDPGLGANRLMAFLQDRARIDRFMDVFKASPSDPQVSDADIVVATLHAGLARVAQIDLFPGQDKLQSIDTHVQHAREHLPRQRARWELIARFLGRLRDLNLLDSTLVCVITEFNRTPGLNANGGKDHNYPDNAVALFGRGIRGGVAVGDRTLFRRSDGFPFAYWSGNHIDFGSGTGEVVKLRRGQATPEGVDLIRPGDVWKTIAASFDERLIRLAPEESRIIPGILV